ncbi:hypothetical protein WN51_08150 [Melipona quadrifasciata]|uniref:Uncharacterized protein n=1 Tax=Melipona quadrifasciata TaxID=166423 RepID=A0A0M8ZR34_9HYME|nr:hypothetical protein WN51_08150 [Melipona quadrifasciata]
MHNGTPPSKQTTHKDTHHSNPVQWWDNECNQALHQRVGESLCVLSDLSLQLCGLCCHKTSAVWLSYYLSTADKALDRGLKHGINFPEHVRNTGPQDHPKRQRASALRTPPWARDLPKSKEREPRERPCFPSASDEISYEETIADRPRSNIAENYRRGSHSRKNDCSISAWSRGFSAGHKSQSTKLSVSVAHFYLPTEVIAWMTVQYPLGGYEQLIMWCVCFEDCRVRSACEEWRTEQRSVGKNRGA